MFSKGWKKFCILAALDRSCSPSMTDDEEHLTLITGANTLP
jgi:hypothetical protein